MNNTRIIYAALTCLALLGNANTAWAFSYAHIDQLAYRLQRQTEVMHREVDIHFRNTPSYQHLHRDVAAMEKLSRHIHDIAHRQGSVEHLRADVEKLDKLFHHIEELLWKMMATHQVDYHASTHFVGVMQNIGGTLHHLRDDLATIRRLHGYDWSHFCYFPQHQCYGYYCPQGKCWFYYYGALKCFLPVKYMQRYSPSNPQLPGNGNVTPPPGARPLPEGVTPPASGAPPQFQTPTPPQTVPNQVPQNIPNQLPQNVPNQLPQTTTPQIQPGAPPATTDPGRTYKYDGGPAVPVPIPG